MKKTVLGIFLVSLLAACGYKGPLTPAGQSDAHSSGHSRNESVMHGY